jgi:hypothetical protein
VKVRQNNGHEKTDTIEKSLAQKATGQKTLPMFFYPSASGSLQRRSSQRKRAVQDSVFECHLLVQQNTMEAFQNLQLPEKNLLVHVGFDSDYCQKELHPVFRTQLFYQMCIG